MSTVTIVAPADMEAGYTFMAEANGQSFPVTVPPGGVKQGQQMQVVVTPSAQVPTGKWSTNLCDCMQVCCTCLCCCSLCCEPVVFGQLLQRLKLGVCVESSSSYRETFTTCLIILAVYWLLLWIPFVGLAIAIFWCVQSIKLRGYMRQRYQIPGSCCGDGCCDDCMCLFCCGCCSTIQMARHTHDEKQFPYRLTATGLPAGAPEIV